MSRRFGRDPDFTSGNGSMSNNRPNVTSGLISLKTHPDIPLFRVGLGSLFSLCVDLL